jgi:hypothetical protein
MTRQNQHEQLRKSLLLHMMMKHMGRAAGYDSEGSSSDSSDSKSVISKEDIKLLKALQDLTTDLSMLERIQTTRYLRACPPVLKCGQIELLFKFAEDPSHRERFIAMVRVSPFVFCSILDMIEDNPVFTNNSNNPQAPVEVQLAVTLYCLGRYGNGASVQDIARITGVSEGSVELYTRRCFDAIERLQPLFVHALSAEEKEVEKVWIDQHLGFRGLWRNGYIMYDGTIIPLAFQPARNGHSYYTRKSNYGLNAQVLLI